MPTVLSLVAVKHLVQGTVTVSQRQTDVTVTVRLIHGLCVNNVAGVFSHYGVYMCLLCDR